MERMSRRDFLKSAAGGIATSMMPAELFGEESEGWPRELPAQVDRLERSLEYFNTIKDAKLRNVVAKKGFPELKRRIADAKENATAQTMEAILKNKDTSTFAAFYDRIERVEKEFARIEEDLLKPRSEKPAATGDKIDP